MALLTQEPMLFQGTVAENLRLGRPDQTLPDEQLWRALETVGAIEAALGIDDELPPARPSLPPPSPRAPPVAPSRSTAS